MLSKEQFDGIVNDLKEQVNRMYWRFEAFNENGLVVEINQQLYKDLLEFRNTLPIDYYAERLDHEGCHDVLGIDVWFNVLTDGVFNCLINRDETYWTFYAIEWINGKIPVKIVDDIDFGFRIVFTESVTFLYGTKEHGRKFPRRR